MSENEIEIRKRRLTLQTAISELVPRIESLQFRLRNLEENLERLESNPLGYLAEMRDLEKRILEFELKYRPTHDDKQLLTAS